MYDPLRLQPLVPVPAGTRHILRLESPFDALAESTQFYQFPTGPYDEYWDIVAVREAQAPPAPLQLHLRLLHIEEDGPFTNWNADGTPVYWSEAWNPFTDESGRVQCNPGEFLGILQFLEQWTGAASLLPVERPLEYFQAMTWDELEQLHAKPFVRTFGETYYRYLPPRDVLDTQRFVSMVHPPHWQAQYGANQLSSLSFITFERARLAEAAFDPFFDATGLGWMVFSRETLKELVLLLKRHIFRNTSGSGTSREPRER